MQKLTGILAETQKDIADEYNREEPGLPELIRRAAKSGLYDIIYEVPATEPYQSLQAALVTRGFKVRSLGYPLIVISWV